MKFFSAILITLFFSLNAFSQMPQAIDKKGVGSVLDMMVAQGVITASDAKKAKEEMNKMNDKDWNELTTKANEVVTRERSMGNPVFRTPANANELPNADAFKEIGKAVKGF